MTKQIAILTKIRNAKVQKP